MYIAVSFFMTQSRILCDNELQVTPVPNTRPKGLAARRCLARVRDINQPVYEPYNYNLSPTCVSGHRVTRNQLTLFYWHFSYFMFRNMAKYGKMLLFTPSP